jgi:hypothetical protein
MDDNYDLWLDAREQTRKAGRLNIGERLVRWVTQSLPGRATSMTAYAIPNASGRGLAIDLNKYRPGRNLKAYQDAGVDIFILRMGGPARWYDGDWQYTLDPTYRPYMEQLETLGLLHRTIGYIVHNPFEVYTINGATGETVHTELIDDWCAGGNTYMPAAFAYDHEVATCWRGATEITCTPYNLVKSLEVNTANTYRKFRRMVGIYTARWFVDKYARTEHIVYLDNVNKPESLGGAGMQRPMWYAWYPQTFSKQYTDLRQSLEDLISPTPTQINNFLQCGSHSLATLWQYTSTLKLTGDDIGVDANVTWGTLSDFLYAWGLPAEPEPPDDPGDPEDPGDPGEPADPDTAAALARIEAMVKDMHDNGISISWTGGR